MGDFLRDLSLVDFPVAPGEDSRVAQAVEVQVGVFQEVLEVAEAVDSADRREVGEGSSR